MSQPFPSVGGYKFKWGPWIVMIEQITDNTGAGDVCVMGHELPDGTNSADYVLWGPQPADAWQRDYAAAGGQGNFTVQHILPKANAYLHMYFPLPGPLPDESNATPYSVFDTNVLWLEWFKAVKSSDGQSAVLTTRSAENKDPLVDITTPVG